MSWPARGPARVLLVLQRPILIELIKLALNHGIYSTRAVATAAEVETTVAEWQPHLVVLDMDFDGPWIMALLSARPGGSGRAASYRPDAAGRSEGQAGRLRGRRGRHPGRPIRA